MERLVEMKFLLCIIGNTWFIYKDCSFVLDGTSNGNHYRPTELRWLCPATPRQACQRIQSNLGRLTRLHEPVGCPLCRGFGPSPRVIGVIPSGDGCPRFKYRRAAILSFADVQLQAAGNRAKPRGLTGAMEACVELFPLVCCSLSSSRASRGPRGAGRRLAYGGGGHTTTPI